MKNIPHDSTLWFLQSSSFHHSVNSDFTNWFELSMLKWIFVMSDERFYKKTSRQQVEQFPMLLLPVWAWHAIPEVPSVTLARPNPELFTRPLKDECSFPWMSPSSDLLAAHQQKHNSYTAVWYRITTSNYSFFLWNSAPKEQRKHAKTLGHPCTIFNSLPGKKLSHGPTKINPSSHHDTPWLDLSLWSEGHPISVAVASTFRISWFRQQRSSCLKQITPQTLTLILWTGRLSSYFPFLQIARMAFEGMF